MNDLNIQISKTEHGYLVDILGWGRDFGMYHDDRGKAWEHFIYLLRNGKCHD